MNINQFKNTIQSAHINFLFGSGLSRPYLTTLGKIEEWLTKADSIEICEIRDVVKASLYAKYFNGVMLPCKDYYESGEKIFPKYTEVLNNYKKFFLYWNEIIAKRNNNLLDKQINIFSTNIDDFVEHAIESCGIEFNDGFKGHLSPIFREDSFSNVVSKISTLYNNSSMIPVFNYMKMHGSINWKQLPDYNITLDNMLTNISEVQKKLKDIPSSLLFDEFNNNTTFDDIKDFATGLYDDSELDEKSLDKIHNFQNVYDHLVMVNPRKSKFRETVLDLHFYELMRLFSNSLEQSSALLLVAGFSFADEHVAKIVVRAANMNPTLLIVVFAYDESSANEINGNIRKAGSLNNNNILITNPMDYKGWFDKDELSKLAQLSKFDLSSLNEYVFKILTSMIK